MTKALPHRPGKGYRRRWTTCSHGHPTLEPDPRDKRGILRLCRQCARIRAQAQADLIRQARAYLQMTHRAYTAAYGQSSGAALAVIAAAEAEAAASTR